MIIAQEYKERRQRLAQSLPSSSIAVITAAQETLRNGDSHYRFRQQSDFYYLTGFNEPNAVLLITSGIDSQSILFNRPRNAFEEQWTGKRLGQEGALSHLLIDESYPIDSFEMLLPQWLAGRDALYFSFGKNDAMEDRLRNAVHHLKSQLRKGMQAPCQYGDLEPILSELRLFKSEAELTLLRRAADISVTAHKRAMQACRRAEYEYELEAELLYEFSRQGCRGVAYDPIVGSGENACILHYTENNKPLKQGDLVLIDAGGEYENYAADITRTFPVSGQFSLEQRLIYELVLKAQQAGIAIIKPGVPWNQIQNVIVAILTEGLCELGILHGNVEQLIAQEAYKPFYMHNSGHWLGLDVHDAGLYKINKQWRPLAAGMVLTVEPGLYLSKDIPGLDSRWWGIGVRIEDDVLVTPTGCEVLTAQLPVTVTEIEALMRD